MAIRKKPGFVRFDLIIVGIAIVGAVLMVSGVTPSFNVSPSNQNEQYVIIPPTSAPGESSLQLKPVKFKKCGATTAVDFLIDLSGSMAWGTPSKISQLEDAILAFASGFSEQTVMSIQGFNEPPAAEIVPFSYYSQVVETLPQTLKKMHPIGGTYSKDAFSFTQNVLNAHKGNYPGYKFSLIFISDGVPETIQSNQRATYPNCSAANPPCAVNPVNPNCRCFAQEQDPTTIAAQIKQSGTRIFTIAYNDASDKALNDQLQNLMRNLASSPTDYYSAPTPQDITDILSEISVKLCQ